jgi:SAM-dependent methyltransferase
MTIEVLGSQQFARGLEIGCSIGVLTLRLSELCRELVSVDVSERAITVARQRCAKQPNVSFERMNVPAQFPDGYFDLIVLSEVGYYWSDADFALARTRIAEAGRGATVELVHFLPKVEDYIRDGDAVHRTFLSDERFEVTLSMRAERYRIDVLNVR